MLLSISVNCSIPVQYLLLSISVNLQYSSAMLRQLFKSAHEGNIFCSLKLTLLTPILLLLMMRSCKFCLMQNGYTAVGDVQLCSRKHTWFHGAAGLDVHLPRPPTTPVPSRVRDLRTYVQIRDCTCTVLYADTKETYRDWCRPSGEGVRWNREIEDDGEQPLPVSWWQRLCLGRAESVESLRGRRFVCIPCVVEVVN
jgi:hypothetical protein